MFAINSKNRKPSESAKRHLTKSLMDRRDLLMLFINHFDLRPFVAFNQTQQQFSLHFLAKKSPATAPSKSEIQWSWKQHQSAAHTSIEAMALAQTNTQNFHGSHTAVRWSLAKCWLALSLTKWCIFFSATVKVNTVIFGQKNFLKIASNFKPRWALRVNFRAWVEHVAMKSAQWGSSLIVVHLQMSWIKLVPGSIGSTVVNLR